MEAKTDGRKTKMYSSPLDKMWKKAEAVNSKAAYEIFAEACRATNVGNYVALVSLQEQMDSL